MLPPLQLDLPLEWWGWVRGSALENITVVRGYQEDRTGEEPGFGASMVRHLPRIRQLWYFTLLPMQPMYSFRFLNLYFFRRLVRKIWSCYGNEVKRKWCPGGVKKSKHYRVNPWIEYNIFCDIVVLTREKPISFSKLINKKHQAQFSV